MSNLPVRSDAARQALQDAMKGLTGAPVRLVLVGRTGVGKSSTINSLLGSPVATVNAFRPETQRIETYEHRLDGATFLVTDTPGLCDGDVFSGQDEKYINNLCATVGEAHLLLYVTPLDETRVRQDEMRGLELLTKALGPRSWRNAAIVFTFADRVSSTELTTYDRERRTLLCDGISAYAGHGVNVPSAMVSNKGAQLPDGKDWLRGLWSMVVSRMSAEGFKPLVLAQANQLSAPVRMPSKGKRQQAQEVVNNWAIGGAATVIFAPPGAASAALIALEGKMCFDIGQIYVGRIFSASEATRVAGMIGITAIAGQIAAIELSHLLGPLAVLAKPAIAAAAIKALGSVIISWFESNGYGDGSGDDTPSSKSTGFKYEEFI